MLELRLERALVSADSISIADAARAYAHESDGEPGLVCNYCPTVWNRLGGLRRFGDQACPNCGDLYPGVNREP